MVSSRGITVRSLPLVELTSDRLAGYDIAFRDEVLILAAGVLDDAGAPAASRHLLRSIESPDLAVEVNAALVSRGARAFNGHAPADPTDGFVTLMLDDRFIAHESFLATVKESVRANGLDPTQLLLSLDPDLGFEPYWSKLQRLRSHGVRVALEGYVPGAPATDLLRRYPFDVVRVDLARLIRTAHHGTGPRPEIHEVGDPGGDIASRADGRSSDPSLIDADVVAHLEAVVDLGHKLGCRVAAEPVTSLAEARLVRRAGCDLASGSALAEQRDQRPSA
jgi:EAL domain-containing protein (putative c-di-GMP-specific phosphodiesterase class I)